MTSALVRSVLTIFSQVVDKVTEEESVVFLGSTAIYPEHVTTPGLYKKDGEWTKSSNAYITCEALKSATSHPIDCTFQVRD